MNIESQIELSTDGLAADDEIVIPGDMIVNGVHVTQESDHVYRVDVSIFTRKKPITGAGVETTRPRPSYRVERTEAES
ncbi:hypothetical protein [Corynebacterium kalidii]